MKTGVIFFVSALMLITALKTSAQARLKANLVYVDQKGVLRYTKNNKEAAFFGVNYTAPFAYSYRAHKRLGVDMEKTIRQDVYQLARLGLDAFRVHIWDTEISDTVGNLLQNEHLRLFDFLLAELKKRNIRAIITAIAFGNNGYPERDEPTSGFSTKYGKEKAALNDTAIVAQENYLKQLFTHTNPYTKLTYRDDPNVIAVELNNEPAHSGAKQGVTDYINRLAAAVRSIGWNKPVYYNIAQNPFYADAIAKANINGVSFQWYPTGLVANHEVKGNFLPNVDYYPIPFDTIAAYRNKARMVYEFDAADVLQSNMYPAMARSFRAAGFQWATQFAYDPTALAYANTEYQTHYLNLLYTPSKAISFLIAGQAFHQLPRLKNYGAYPADSIFGVFRVSYNNALSEMNSPEAFYYSRSTDTRPVDMSALKHIAGVGHSAVVKYDGSGAYFLDKLSDSVWRLEVYPDAVYIRDPFERASPQKEVTRLQWQFHSMQLFLPGLSTGFSVKGLNEGNAFSLSATAGNFQVYPGTYLLSASEKEVPVNKVGVIGLNEYGAAEMAVPTEMLVRHEPFNEVSAGKAFAIKAQIVGLDTGRAMVHISKAGNWSATRILPMVHQSFAEYAVEIPADFVTAGEINYRIVLQKGNAFAVFPGNHKQDPFAWDNYNTAVWQTFVAPRHAKLELFNPTTDRSLWFYPDEYKKGFQSSYTTAAMPRQLILQLATTGFRDYNAIGFANYIGNKLQGRMADLDAFDTLVVRARTAEPTPVKVKLLLTDKNAFAFSALITLTNDFQNIAIPLNELVPDSLVLLPNAYPGFLPVWFKAAGNASFKLTEIEKIQLVLGKEWNVSEPGKRYSLEIASIWLE